MYQNNIAAEDGLLDGKNLSQAHPYFYFNEQMRQEYTKMGETAFIYKYRHAFLAYLKKKPLDFVNKCTNRILHMFFSISRI